MRVGGREMNRKLFVRIFVQCAAYSFFSVLLLLLGMYLFDERLRVDKCDVLCGIAIGMTTVILPK